MKEITLKKLISDMRKDKTVGSLYYVWQSNIAMAIYDEMDGKVSKEKANDCAKRFLDELLTQK